MQLAIGHSSKCRILPIIIGIFHFETTEKWVNNWNPMLAYFLLVN